MQSKRVAKHSQDLRKPYDAEKGNSLYEDVLGNAGQLSSASDKFCQKAGLWKSIMKSKTVRQFSEKRSSVAGLFRKRSQQIDLMDYNDQISELLDVEEIAQWMVEQEVFTGSAHWDG